MLSLVSNFIDFPGIIRYSLIVSGLKCVVGKEDDIRWDVECRSGSCIVSTSVKPVDVDCISLILLIEEVTLTRGL